MESENAHRPPTSETKSKASLLVWSLPIAALALVLWMGYQSITSKGLEITITFNDGQGLLAGKTLLLYKGIEVGKVESTRLSDDLSQVIATIELTSDSKGIAVEGSQFWIARPEISLAGIRGLDTILSGVYIQVEPGKGIANFSFHGLPSAAIVSGAKELSIVLLAKRARSIDAGSPIYFRDIQVGQIKGHSLSEDGQLIIIEAGVDSEYAHLVRSGSKFWNESGIDVKAGLLGIKIRTDSLETIIGGGISFATPSHDQAGNLAEPHAVFTLFEEPDNNWLEWIGTTTPNTELTLDPKTQNEPTSQKQKKEGPPQPEKHLKK